MPVAVWSAVAGLTQQVCAGSGVVCSGRAHAAGVCRWLCGQQWQGSRSSCVPVAVWSAVAGLPQQVCAGGCVVSSGRAPAAGVCRWLCGQQW